MFLTLETKTLLNKKEVSELKLETIRKILKLLLSYNI